MHWYRGKIVRICKHQQTSVCIVAWMYVTINICKLPLRQARLFCTGNVICL